MYYAIISEDAANSLSLRQANRPAHLARLQALQDENRLLLAGPHPAEDSPTPTAAGFTGSLVVAQFESLTQAEDWASCDPYQLAGVYAKVRVKPFIKVFP